jgi:hypothetical protein
MSVIMMNLFAGPPLFRAAVISVGEARALQLPSQTGDVRLASPRQEPSLKSLCHVALNANLTTPWCNASTL